MGGITRKPGRSGAVGATLGIAIALLTATASAREYGTPRDTNAISAIVIHTIGGPACIGFKVQFRPIPYRPDDAEFWQKLLNKAPIADAHYVIGRGGQLEEVIPVDQVANHTLGVNPISIGIELVHRGDGHEPFEEPQIVKLIDTIKALRVRFPAIQLANIVTHSALDQETCTCGSQVYRRRQDPGANFPLARVIDAVKLPDDPKDAPTRLPRLTGPSPKFYCPIF